MNKYMYMCLYLPNSCDCKVSNNVQKTHPRVHTEVGAGSGEVAGDIAGTVDPDSDPSKTKEFKGIQRQYIIF